MAHQCVRCSKTLENNAPELVKGCECGGRVFLFVREGENANSPAGSSAGVEGWGGLVAGKPKNGVTHLGGGVASVADLTDEQKRAIENKLAPLADERPVSIQLDAENIRVVNKGHYLLNLKSLFDAEPVVIRNAKGVYYVHFPLSQAKARKNAKK